ncbi:hypothetical protein ACLOJK_012767 [Asimina triloba]
MAQCPAACNCIPELCCGFHPGVRKWLGKKMSIENRQGLREETKKERTQTYLNWLGRQRLMTGNGEDDGQARALRGVVTLMAKNEEDGGNKVGGNENLRENRYRWPLELEGGGGDWGEIGGGDTVIGGGNWTLGFRVRDYECE